jgi:hypothetical protein
VFKKGMIAAGAVFVLLLLLYFSFDFMSDSNKEILKQARSGNNPQVAEAVKTFFDGLKADRSALMIGDLFRSFAFFAAAGILLFLLIRNTIKPLVAIIGLQLLLLIDLFPIDAKYLNSITTRTKTRM